MHAFPRISQKCRAVSLLEMLVSVAIVSLLASLLLTGVGRFRQTAVRAGCEANLRGIYAALAAYSADNNGRLPDILTAINKTNVTWDRALVEGGYLDGIKALKCPADKLPRMDPSPLDPWPARTYALNNYVFDGPDNYKPQNPTWAAQGRLQNARRPFSRIVMMWDRATPGQCYGRWASVAFDGIAASPGGIDPNSTHGNGANYLFADGHIEFLDYNAMNKGSLSASASAFSLQYFPANPPN